MELLANHLAEILSFIGGVLAGSFITYNFTKQNSQNGSGSLTDQSGARAGGDIVGGDKNSNN